MLYTWLNLGAGLLPSFHYWWCHQCYCFVILLLFHYFFPAWELPSLSYSDQIRKLQTRSLSLTQHGSRFTVELYKIGLFVPHVQFFNAW